MRRLTAASLVGGLLLAAAPMFVQSASAVDYTATATIKRNAPNGVSVTDRQFRHTFCPVAPPTQDLDAHIFTLPAGYNGAGTTVTVTAPSTSVHDLGAYIYDYDAGANTCTLDHQIATPTSFDLSFTTNALDTFVVVYSMTGSNVAVTFTATPGTPTGQHAEGLITRQSVGFGVTDTEFASTCLYPPASQGVDGWVFSLDNTSATTVNITADTLVAHDLVAFVYDASCTFLGQIDQSGSDDLSFTPGSTDKYYSVITLTGGNLLTEFDAS